VLHRIAIFGLGEAGSLIATDLLAKDVPVVGYDPKPVPTPPGVTRVETPQEAVKDADIVVAIAPGGDALWAIEQALDQIPPTALYADFSTNSATIKQQLAKRAASRGIAFADVALMTVVPGKGLRTPVMVSGTGAESFATVFTGWGMPLEVVGGEAGQAATRKLLRSVMMKGLAAVIIESMRAGEAAGCANWLWGNLTAELAAADEKLITRLVTGTAPHAQRRLHEMECTAELLQDLGVDPLMTRSTVESLHRVLAEGIPVIPENGSSIP